MLKKYTSLFLCCLLTGCAGGNDFSNENSAQQPVSGPYAIDVHWGEPPIPYMILGQVRGVASVNTSDEAMIFALQREAEKLHAHAIVLPQEAIRIVRSSQGDQKMAMATAVYYVRKAESSSDVPSPDGALPNEEDILMRQQELLKEMESPARIPPTAPYKN